MLIPKRSEEGAPHIKSLAALLREFYKSFMVGFYLATKKPQVGVYSIS
jgi:hypothetical protein